MTTKADDVIELGRARALLGCSSTMSLLDGVRAIKSELHDALRRIEELEEQHAYARQADGERRSRGSTEVGEGNPAEEPAPDYRRGP
jgi:hypothetical protein